MHRTPSVVPARVQIQKTPGNQSVDTEVRRGCVEEEREPESLETHRWFYDRIMGQPELLTHLRM